MSLGNNSRQEFKFLKRSWWFSLVGSTWNDQQDNVDVTKLIRLSLYVPEHVVWRAGRVVPSGHAGVHAVWALQAQCVIRLFSSWRRLVVQDGVMNQRRVPHRTMAQCGAVGHDGGVGRRWGERGHEVGLGAVECLPLALSLCCCSLLELGQTATLLFYHLLTWREVGRIMSGFVRVLFGAGRWHSDWNSTLWATPSLSRQSSVCFLHKPASYEAEEQDIPSIYTKDPSNVEPAPVHNYKTRNHAPHIQILYVLSLNHKLKDDHENQKKTSISTKLDWKLRI